MTAIMTTRRDLDQWVADRVGSGVTEADIAAIVAVIRADPKCPAWGRDWFEFLDVLPEDLCDLID